LLLRDVGQILTFKHTKFSWLLRSLAVNWLSSFRKNGTVFLLGF